ncbi:MAG: zinc ribbon domain-containing protein [Phycisphaerae bacterium]|nr:zinc ribbon domain-containing protein [Phycisphaerae bacterium]
MQHDEEYYDPEGPGPEDDDLLDDDATDTRTCPSCGAEIYAGADRCPNCGQWITSGPWTRKHRSKIAFASLILAVLLMWWLMEWDVLELF